MKVRHKSKKKDETFDMMRLRHKRKQTIVYLGDPRETTSRRGLKLEPLVWPRNVVGVRTLLELVNVVAIVSLGLSFVFA